MTATTPTPTAQPVAPSTEPAASRYAELLASPFPLGRL